MLCEEIIGELRSRGTESTRRIMMNHGAPDSNLGVKVEDLKKILIKVKKNYPLSLELYDSGIPDAQYLAGLMADETRMSEKDLQHWAENASWHMISEYTVPWIAAESLYGWEMSLNWIDDEQESIQSSGWLTLASLVAIKPDTALDISTLEKLMNRVKQEISKSSNRVPFAMNYFLIATGGYVKDLSEKALLTAHSLGKITLNVSGTASKVPYAPDYIQKMLDRGVKKKKMARC